MSKIPTADGLPSLPILTGSAADAAAEAREKAAAMGASESTARHAKKASEFYPQPPPSRFSLRLSAGWWRSLQCIGMAMHFMAPPRPPNPSFVKTASSTLSKKKGEFTMQFYTPKGYDLKKRSPSPRSKKNKGERENKRYPCVVNFHGGGFTIGNGTDDARFARVVLETCEAIFVSVDYRLAPEYPFPTAVEDGADALLYIIRHADELRIDPMRLATSGFSAGGNLALTAPMRLKETLDSETGILAKSSTGSSDLKREIERPVPEHRILAVATWYPITDYTLTRAHRRAKSIRPDQTLPPTLTNIFDAAYLYPADLDLADPCLSPSKGSDEVLRQSLPPHVIIYTCEWDMLLQEGEELAHRLERAPIGKNVRYRMIEGVPHGWDKGPDPRKPAEKSEELYKECCDRLKEIFGSG